MSEKQVNIKITASTKDFDNAIKKAQKQIEELADAIDALGSSKFGNKLEEQFDDLVKALKKAEEEVSNIQKTFDDLSKIKLNKAEDGLKDVAKAGEELNDTLEKTTDNIEGIDKVKFNKIDQQFKDIVASGEDVSTKAKDILDLLDKVDKQDLNGLESEFNQIHSALEKISTETRNSTEDMEKRFGEVTEEVNDFINKLNDVDYVHFNEFSDVLQDANKRLEELTEQQNKFNKATGELDSSGIDKFADSMNKINGANGTVNMKNDSSNKGKSNNSLADGITEGLASSIIEGKVLKDTMEDVADSIKDAANSMERLADIADNDIDKSIDDLGEEYKEAESALEKLTKEHDELIKKQKELNDNKLDIESRNNEYKNTIQPLIDKYKELQDVMNDKKGQLDKRLQEEKDAIEQYTQGMEELKRQTLENNEATEKQKKELDDLSREYDETAESASKLAKYLNLINSEYESSKKRNDRGAFGGLNFVTPDGKEIISSFKTFDEYEQHLREVEKEYDDLIKKQAELSEQISKGNDNLKYLEQEKEEYREIAEGLEQFNKALPEMQEETRKAAKEFADLEKRAEGVAHTVKQLTDLDIAQDNQLEKLKEQMQETDKAAEGLTNDMDALSKKMAENNKVAQGHADAFDKQYKAYEKLSQEVKAYLEDEKNGILQRERAAKSFKQVADSMEAIYKGSSKFDNADLITETLAEAAEYVKDLNLVSTENLQADLKRLGEIVEDKTEKIKRFKELNKDFGSDASRQAYGLEKQAQAIRDWANSADFALEASKTLTNAWGDLKAAGEDHLKIRQRSKYIEDFGKALEENVAHIKNYYHELETLDEIYEECTDVQKGIIDDYRIWEKNRDALLKYNKEITDYLRTVRDSGGQIDVKFLDELGNFSPQKFIDNFEKLGATSLQLQKQFNANKIELLEWLKVEKEARQEAVKHAEEALEQAKADKKAAESQEELAEATEKVTKAQENLAEAKKKQKSFVQDADKELRTLKEIADKLNSIGMAAKIDYSDIEGFDKSLASLLKRMGTFDDDLPKTFGDLKEDIAAVFSDLDSLSLDGVLDGLKDIGGGILSKIPREAKAAAVAIGAITIALKECAEIGINQFTRGMETVGNALSSIAGLARDIGQEIGDAFSNITGMELDFSSLMEIPVNFESQMAKVGAIAGATGDDFKELEKEARRLGATTRYSATEVAEAMEYMGMAGWTNTQILAKSKDGLSALESVLKLATVAQMDLGQASDFVTDGLTALGLEAEEASYMVDLLAAASTSSNTTVAQMQRAFTNCAPVLGTLAKELENPTEALKDLSMALGLMADKGVKGAKAGTALKNLMANMSAPTEKQLEYIKEFNLQGAQQDITQGKLIDGIKKMQKALSGLTPKQQNAVITAIAGKEALSGVSALLNTTSEDMAKLESALDNCDGAAKSMADTFDDTLEGALKGLASAMQETLLQLRDMTKGAEDSLVNLVNQITGFFSILNGMGQPKGYEKFSGLADAIAYLEDISQGWGDNIADGLHKVISAIDDFVNSASFDNILQIGTNIINGIADGIKRAAKDGSLDSAISTAIRKIATWFSENLDTIVEVGKEIIDAISKGISENSDEIGEVIKTVMEMQTEIDKAIAKEKWKLIGQNLISFICEGIVSKASVFVSAFTGFFEGCIGDIANAFNDLVVNKLSPMLLDPLAIMGEGIGNFLKDVLLSALERAFDIDLSYFKDFNIFNPSSWFGDKDKKKNTSNKKSNSSNKGNKDTGSGISGMWSNFKKEIESWGKEFDSIKKNIESWGKDFNLWETISDWFKEGEEVSANIRQSIAGLWTNNIEPEFGKLKENISSWGANVGTWFSNSWSGAKEELSQWKTGISEWGTETSEELSKAGNNIKTFFTETLPSYFNPEKLGSALGTFTGTIARVTVDAWESFNTWGEDLYNKGSEAAINYSNGIRDFIVELPGNISTWLTDAWTAVDTWGNNLYIKGSEAAIKYSNGIRDFFTELPGKITTWVTNAWSAVDTWGNDLYTKGSEAAIKYSDGIRDYFAELYNKISTWLTDAWSAVDTWGTNLYTKGSEAAIRYSDGIRDFFVELPGKVTTWLSDVTKSFTKWCNELYTKGKEAINNLIKGITDGFKQLPGKITSGLNSGKKAVTTWGNDVKKSASSAGKNIVNGIFSGMSEFKSAITNWCSRFKSSFLSSFKKAFGIHSPSTVMRDEVGVNLALGIEEGLNSGAGDIAQTAGNILSSVKGSIGDIWSGLFGNNDNPELLNISPEGIKAATASLNALSLTLADAKENIGTIGKTFNALGLSLTNVSEITNAIRVAFMSIANIIANQVTNARNVLTQQFLSMAAVARTQMVNISNIVRNQAVAWNNIIANQAKNARDNLTRQFISMAKVASTQMGKVTAAVKSSMSNIASATSRGISINVNRSVSTGYAMPSANALYAANAASTYSLGGNTGALYGGASTMSTGRASSSNNSRGMSDNITLEIPLYLDGREVARATARYVDNELKLMTKRENRKRGAK